MRSRKLTAEEREQVRTWVTNLSDQEWLELARHARRHGLGEDAEDAVQDTLIAAFTGGRGCTLDVNKMAFLKGSIKSRACGIYRTGRRRAEARERYFYHATCSSTSDRGQEVAREIVCEIVAALAEDPRALDVLYLLPDKDRVRACAEVGMELKQFDTARRRIKRRAHHAAAIATLGFRRHSFF